jgi:hypothetical protein
MGLDCNRTQEMKEILEHFQAVILQVDLLSRLRQSTGESGEHGERLRIKRTGDYKKGMTCSMVEPGHSPASAFQEDSIQKLVLQNTNDEQMHETEAISSRNIEASESIATMEIEFSAGSTFLTPQKTKLLKLTDPKMQQKHSSQKLQRARKEVLLVQLLAIPL